MAKSNLVVRKMTADKISDASGKNSSMVDKAPNITNRLFLSHIDYTNYDEGTGDDNSELAPEEVQKRLEELFSKFGSVLEVYLSDKEDPNLLKDKDKARPPFGFIAMETAEEARLALEEFGSKQHKNSDNRKSLSRNLFRDVTPAHVHKSKNNKQNKNERLRSQRVSDIHGRSALIDSANVLCQVHTSHLDRLREFVAARNGVTLVSSFSAQKGTSFLILRVDKSAESHPVDPNASDDYLERFSRTLWDTWYIAPNLNRVTLWNNSKHLGTDSRKEGNRHRVQGNIRTGVVPAIFHALSEIDNGNKVSLRVAVFPPKLQRALLEGLEEYNQKRKEDENDCCKNMDIQFSPGNPTHTISIIQLHPGVIVNPKRKGDNDKALYVVGRLEVVPLKRKRSLSDGSVGSENSRDNKYRLQQQRTSHVPQLLKPRAEIDNTLKAVAQNSNPKALDSVTVPEDDKAIGNDDDKSISRAYWKLQEVWERYNFKPPSLVAGPHRSETERLWALDCGAAPGGWTKFLFRPGIVDRIYAVDPGDLSPAVVPGLDKSHPVNESSPIVRHVATTIQKALPEIASELTGAVSVTNGRKNQCLDIWVSDMCVKDASSQIDCFLQARSLGVVGPGTFFVLTLKFLLGYSATAFEHQTKEQVQRLEGISRDVHVVHLFSNRSSERTIIGYLV